MIDYRQLVGFGAELLIQANVDEVRIRQAVSASYYSLFHHLSSAAAAVFDDGGPSGHAIAAQAARALSHATARKVCRLYGQTPRLPAPLSRMHQGQPDKRLAIVSNAFLQLQEARETADYDLSVTISRADGLQLIALADFANWKLEELELAGSPDLRVYLAALLLSDRWQGRG